ncbi:MAG: glycosyltransferase, partial [Rhodospirillales bacterium]
GTRAPGPFRFLVAGKIGAHQTYRLTRAIEALGLLEDRQAELVIAGVIDPMARGAAEDAAKRSDVAHRLTWRGPYDRQTAPALYQSADAFVTLTHQDACPSAVIEAMASGLAVVHPASGGTPELVGSTGAAIPAHEDWEEQVIPAAEAVAEAMASVQSNHGLLAQSARARAVENFDIRPWIERQQALFQTLLVGRAAR